METKICPFPECTHSGESQSIEQFRDKRGRETIGCFDCRRVGRGRYKREYLKIYKKRPYKNSKPKFEPTPVEPWQIARLNKRIIEITRGSK